MLELLALAVGFLLSKAMTGTAQPEPQPQPHPYPPQPQPNPCPYPPQPQPNPFPSNPWPSPQPTPGAAAGRVYNVADGDAAYLVAARLSGTVKDSQGRWQWKWMTKQANGDAIDTSGVQPKPWFAGMQIEVPAGWTVDTGARAGAKGTVAPKGSPPVPQPPQPGPIPPKPSVPGPIPGQDVPVPGAPSTPGSPGAFDNQGTPYNPSVSGDDLDESDVGDDSEGTV